MLLTSLLIILILLVLILSKKMSAMGALILVPVVGALLAGFGWETFDFALKGIKDIAPVVAMFVFAILFFGILTDAGMFNPIINTILKWVGTNPTLIAVGTALLAMTVHFDGSGATTFLIVIPAILPLYEKLQMDRRVMACVVSLAAGTMNLLPWGGPTIRAASALNLSVTEIYSPVMIPQLVGLLFVIFIAWHLGKKESKRLNISNITYADKTVETDDSTNTSKSKFFWLNVGITLIALYFLISGLVPPALVFMIGTVLVLMLNFPNLEKQKDLIFNHSRAAILMASILLAAGVFTGIMKESGMIAQMAESAVDVIPTTAGKKLPLILAVLSMPLSFLFDPNSFYFGFLPILAQTGAEFGIAPATMGQAAILGQMTTGFPLSPLTAATFLLIGLAKVDLADHQKFTFKYAFLTTLVMTSISVIMGVIPI
ncbi:CitMHS family transporter [Flagellimonas zhangzhouensis]|uniref:Citrate-Mg2+:H+ or citrate-Ca2+:H+ symporter, CitMHS family n=1 Tax=Flagellimonas zhangzhouensis TaxID=1073328 RepID=A0A1H2YBL9_9FLAO|nr:citrate:proton symporter [Allomuricauda zhangzhouensis]SDX02430.1 citrate-Mg2+:H+ or citrate-Ca2+:H+ symporter, CitMHS family [Allomuricauda zhangzhouensis]